jgi:hypothetical protein
VEDTSRRWCFYISFPFCGLGLVAALFFVCPRDVLNLPFADGLRQMGWASALLFVSGMTSLLVGISWGGTQYLWGSAAMKTVSLRTRRTGAYSNVFSHEYDHGGSEVILACCSSATRVGL